MATTGELIQAARHRAHLTQRELGNLIGGTNTLVSHIEANRKPVTDFPALAAALGVSMESIIGTNPAPTHPRLPTRAENPPPRDLPVAMQDEHYIGMQALLRWVKDTYGFKPGPGQIYKWVHDKTLPVPFPAYRNSCRKNPQGEFTLSFRTSEVRVFFEAMIRPIN